MENIGSYFDQGMALAIEYTPKLLLAIITLLIGLKIIKLMIKLMKKGFEKKEVDTSLSKFLGNLVSWIFKILLFISVAAMIGIHTTSFVALLGAAGLAVGLAMQGTLANFAGGVLIMIFKPYKVGDLIKTQGHLGIVIDIQIFTTHLASFENQKIILANGVVSNGDIVNYSALGKIRVDLTMGISYDSDIKKARAVLVEKMQAHPKVLKDPAPFVGVAELADSAISLAVRPWCDPNDYWDVFFDILESGKEALDASQITIPFPQMDVHLKEKNT